MTAEMMSYGEWRERYLGRTENKKIKISTPSSPKSLERSLKAIRENRAGLSKARKQILKKVPKSNDYYRFERGKNTIRDLAYLSAETGHEFALFRGKNEDLLIHGNSRTCNPNKEISEETIKRGYDWIAHSHVDLGKLTSSAADRQTLKLLGQYQSVIIGPTGKEITFKASSFD